MGFLVLNKDLPPRSGILTTVGLEVSPRSPTARVHVAAGGNIVRKSFLLMAKCRGDGREPSQRMQRAVVAVLWC